MTLSDLIPGASQAKAIVGGIMVAGILALGIWVWRVDGLRAQHLADLQTAKAQLVTESNAHQVTIASLAQCQGHLNDMNAQADERAKNLAEATADYQAQIAALKKESAAQEKQRAFWQGMASKYQREGKCPIPDELRAELNR